MRNDGYKDKLTSAFQARMDSPGLCRLNLVDDLRCTAPKIDYL